MLLLSSHLDYLLPEQLRRPLKRFAGFVAKDLGSESCRNVSSRTIQRMQSFVSLLLQVFL